MVHCSPATCLSARQAMFRRRLAVRMGLILSRTAISLLAYQSSPAILSKTINNTPERTQKKKVKHVLFRTGCTEPSPGKGRLHNSAAAFVQHLPRSQSDDMPSVRACTHPLRAKHPSKIYKQTSTRWGQKHQPEI